MLLNDIRRNAAQYSQTDKTVAELLLLHLYKKHNKQQLKNVGARSGSASELYRYVSAARHHGWAKLIYIKLVCLSFVSDALHSYSAMVVYRIPFIWMCMCCMLYAGQILKAEPKTNNNFIGQFKFSMLMPSTRTIKYIRFYCLM